MKITFDRIKEYQSLEDITIKKEYTLLLIGEAIDERSQYTQEYLQAFNLETIELIYQNTSDSFLSNNIHFKRSQLTKFIEEFLSQKGISTVILECTSLGYTEILTILYILSNLNESLTVNIIYTEPKEYRNNKKDLLEGSYELSEDYNDHKYIIPFIFKEAHDTTSNQKATLVTFIGFEENRLGRILDENNYDNKYNEIVSIIAVPGFQFGWENISLSKHHHLLEQNKELYYTPADDPYETYKILTKIAENLHPKRIVIMPIGTKPCAIGASIFLVNHKKEMHENNLLSQIATKYDFPVKSKNRTSGIGNIYEYSLSFQKK